MDIKIKNILNQFKILRSLKARIFIIVFLIGIIPSVIINDHTAVIQIGKLFQLRADHLGRSIRQVIIGDQMIGYRETALMAETSDGEKPKGEDKPRDIVRGVMLTSVSTDSIVVTM